MRVRMRVRMRAETSHLDEQDSLEVRLVRRVKHLLRDTRQVRRHRHLGAVLDERDARGDQVLQLELEGAPRQQRRAVHAHERKDGTNLAAAVA
jgi:hypothetical protein